jgi:hypothetical protein
MRVHLAVTHCRRTPGTLDLFPSLPFAACCSQQETLDLLGWRLPGCSAISSRQELIDRSTAWRPVIRQFSHLQCFLFLLALEHPAMFLPTGLSAFPLQPHFLPVRGFRLPPRMMTLGASLHSNPHTQHHEFQCIVWHHRYSRRPWWSHSSLLGRGTDGRRPCYRAERKAMLSR